MTWWRSRSARGISPPVLLRSPIVEADYRLDPPGAMPRADDAERLLPTALPRRPRRRTPHDARPDASRQELLAGLRTVSTATLASLLASAA